MYTLSSSDKGRAISVFEDGQLFVADDSHANFEAILEAVTNGEPSAHLFNIATTLTEKFEKLSDRVSVSGNNIYFDNEPVHSALAQQVLSFLREGHDFRPLVRFWENLEQNQNEHSRNQTFDWLNAHNFTIDSRGYIVAYKGVQTVGDNLESFLSISSGTAISDGVTHTGQIPQKVGSVVEMPRSSVQFNPAVGCSTGLHAGTWEYASGFAQGAVLTVAIHPRDVVSVPTDCGHQKMRVSRYTVTGVTEMELPSYVSDDVDGYDDDWFDSYESDVYGYEEEFVEDVKPVEEKKKKHANDKKSLSKRAKKQKRDSSGKFTK